MEISSCEAGNQWARDMTSWAEENAINENICEVSSNGTEDYRKGTNAGSRRYCELACDIAYKFRGNFQRIHDDSEKRKEEVV